MTTDLNTLTNEQLLLRIVAAERDCPNGSIPGYVRDNNDHTPCPVCRGTGKVPSLSPVLMRRPCPGIPTGIIDGSRYHSPACPCKNRAGHWIPNPDPWAMKNALRQAGWQLIEKHTLSVESKDGFVAEVWDDKRPYYGARVVDADPKRARLLAGARALTNLQVNGTMLAV